MDKYRTEQIRNVGLISHGGSGKTSLSEAMLFNARAISRLGRVDDGATTSDFEPEEVKRKISLDLSLLPFEWKGAKINLIDIPGYADFVGEVVAASRAIEGAVLVVSAVAGVEAGTEQAWKYAEDAGIARLIFINKIDRENADFFKVVAQIEATLGRKCVPIQLPLGAETKFEGVFDLISPAQAPASLGDNVQSFREKLIEVVAETDDALTTKYLDGQELTPDEIGGALRAGTAAGEIVPILVGSALQNKGVNELMDAMVEYLPSPKEKGKIKGQNVAQKQEELLEPNDAAPLAALIFKTTADPYVGKLTYLRVYSGVLNSDSSVWNCVRNRPERIGQLYLIRGKNQEPAPSIGAGDIGAISKLAESVTGDTLCAKEHPVVLDTISFPAPRMSMAVHPKTKADTEKLGAALARLAEEDRTLAVRKDPDTNETVLLAMGDTHIDAAVEKMKRKFGVDVTVSLPRIPYKETISAATRTDFKHKKQTGGHGQYGHVVFDIEPLPRGSGNQFEVKVVGGAVPKNFIPAVEKGVHEALHEGVLAGYPLTDMHVKLVDGSSHPVDSSEMSFKIAASHGLRKGVGEAQPTLLEPIMNVQITVPEGFTGDVISDLNTKRAKVSGMMPQDGSSVIEAQAPLSEMQRYATDLRSITQGRGSFSMTFSHYEEVPQHIAQKIIADAQKTPEKV